MAAAEAAAEARAVAAEAAAEARAVAAEAAAVRRVAAAEAAAVPESFFSGAGPGDAHLRVVLIDRSGTSASQARSFCLFLFFVLARRLLAPHGARRWG